MKTTPDRKNYLSDELYDKIMDMAKKNPGKSATVWIHLADAVDRGTISPLDAYDCVNAGYVFENLKVRESAYSHLL
jgi:hypothetical protein